MKRLLTLVVLAMFTVVGCTSGVKKFVREDTTREQEDKDYMECYSATQAGLLSVWSNIFRTHESCMKLRGYRIVEE